MIPNILEWLNEPLPGDPDPIVTRTIVGFFIMIVATKWTYNMVSRWPGWVREQRRVTLWLTSILVGNGAALLAAMERDDPVRIATGILAVSFAGTATAMLVRFANDDSTAPVYPWLYPSNIAARFRPRR